MFKADPISGPVRKLPRQRRMGTARRRSLLVERLEDRRLLAGNQPPEVLSVVRADSNPTNAQAVNFTVTFDEPVRFVDAIDFQLISAGSVSGATLTQVIPQTANTYNSIYTVAVNSGSGDGTLKLNVIDDNSIRDQQNDRLGGNGAGNGNYTSGETYTIDKTVPTVASISLIGTPTASASTIEYNVTFSEAVTGVNTGDFQLIATGLTGSSINSVAGSGTSYVVQVAVGAGEGTIQVALVDDDSIVDVATNALGGVGTGSQVNGPTHTVESVAPTVTSIVAAQPNPTNAALVDFTVTFSEPVLNVGLNDFALTIGGGITGAMITNVAGTPDTFIVTVSTGSGDGTIRLGMFNPPTITDLGGNAMTTSTTTSPVITIDKTMPTMSQSLLDPSPTNAASVRYQVTFSEPVTGLSTSNLQAYVLNSGTPDLSGLSITSITGSGASYVVTIATGTGNGAIGLKVVNDGNFKDAVGNAPTVLGGTGAAYVIDRIAPIVESVVLENVSPTNSASLSFLVTLDEAVQVFQSSDVAVDQVGFPGALVSSVQYITGTQKRVIVTPGIGEGTLSIDILPQASATDFAGNQLATPANNFDAYTVDTRKPSVSSISLVGPTATNASSIAFDVTFSESVSNVTAADFALATSGITGAAITGVVGGGTNYTVAVGTGTFNGTIRLNATNSGTLQDGLGNPLAANFTGAVATIDRSAPTVLSISSPTSTTNATNIDYTITFSEPVTGLTASNLSLVTGGTISSAAIASIQGSGSVYTVSINTGNGDGTVGLNINASTAIVDAVGNNLSTGLSGNVVTVDKSSPTITTFASATSLLTNLSNIHFDVIFSEPVLGLDIADLTLTTIGLTGASIEQITGNGTTYSIRVSTGTGDGNARLALATLPTITDTAGNALQAVSLQSELVTIDKTTPTSMTITGVSPAGVTVTNATSIQYEVVFAEPVTGITSAAFYPHTNQTGNLTGLSVSSVSGSGTTYLVSINIGFGNRGPLLLGIDNSAGLIKDLAGNAIAYIQGTGFNYVIDRVAPEVEFIRRASTSPTPSTALVFDVLFNEPVTGVDASDFALSTTGVSGAMINSVTGNGTSYTVNVTHSGGIGTVGLNLVDDNSIEDLANNKLGGSLVGDGNFAGEVYEIASSTITGTVYSDVDSDGLRDTVDAGLPGVTVYLDIDGNGVRNVGEPSAVTSASPAGQFTIGNLDAGTYEIRVDAFGNTRQSSPMTTADGTKLLTLFSNLVPPTGRTSNEPTAIAVAPDGNFAVFATSDTGRIGSLARNPVDGSMTLINELQYALFYSEVENIAYHPGGKFVYAASRGFSVINVFSVANNGTISFVEAISQSNNANINQPREVLVTPDGSQLIIAAKGSGSVLVYAINQTTGRLTLSQTFKEGVGGVTGIPSASYITISPDGGLIAVRNFNTDNSVQFFNRNVVTGVVSIGQSGITIPNPSPTFPLVYDLQFSPDGKHLYVSDDAGKIFTLNRDAVTGVVSLGGSTSTGTLKANLLAISPDGSSLVATSDVGDAVMQFARDAATGGLTLVKSFVEGIDFYGLNQPRDIEISPDGADVYVIARANDRIVQFKFDQTDRVPASRTVTLAPNQTQSGVNFSVASASPTVTAFASAVPSTITTNSIDFNIQFSEPVTGVTPSALRLYDTTIVGASVASVTGSGSNWTVSVVTPDGEGFVQLEIVDNNLILDVDSASLGGPGTGGIVARSERVFADSLAPSVVEIATSTNVPVGATSVDFYVSFREPVTGFDTTDLITSATGNLVSSVSSVTPTSDPQVYVATVGITGSSGSVTLALVDDDTIVDTVLNVLGGVGTSGSGDGGFVSSAVVIGAPTISGVIWEDSNQNGRRDPGEGGLADVIVFVDLNDSGSRDTGEPFVVSQADNLSTTQVNESGRYVFSGLEAATTYSILVDDTILTQFNPVAYSQDNGLLTYKDQFIANSQPDISLLSAETVIASADGRHLYTTSLNGHTLGVFARDFANDSFLRVQSINSFSPGFSGLNFPQHFALTPDGRFGYLGSTETIHVVARDPATGLLTFTSKLNPGDAGPSGLTGSTAFVASPDSRWLYASDPARGLSVFAIDQIDGSLTLMQQFVDGENGVSGLYSVQNVDVTPDGSQVFVTTYPDQELQIFDVTPGSGRLVLAQRITGVFRSEDFAISPDGNFAYLALTDSDHIHAYSRNAITGNWNLLSSVNLNPGDASSIDISSDGRFVYVADEVSHSITVLQRNTTSGALTVIQTLLDEAPHSALNGIRQVIVTPEGKEAFAVSYNDSSLTRFSRVGGTTTAIARDVTTNFVNNNGGDFGVFNPAPMVTSISTTATSPHLAAQISFDVEFSEDVINVTAADFALTTTGVLTGMSIGAITGTGNTRNVVMNYGGGSGTVRLDVVAGGTVIDVGGKTVADAYTSGPVVAVGLPKIIGTVRRDVDEDGLLDLADQFGIAGRTVYLDTNNNNLFDAGEPTTITLADEPLTTTINEAGRFEFTLSSYGDYRVGLLPLVGWSQTSPVMNDSFNHTGSITSIQTPSSAADRVYPTPDGNHVYAVDQSVTAGLSGYVRDWTTGLLTAMSSFSLGAGTGVRNPTEVALSPDSKWMIALEGNVDNVKVLARNGSTGALTLAFTATNNAGGFSGLDSPERVAVSKDGSLVYIYSRVSRTITVLAMNNVTGALTQMQTLPLVGTATLTRSELVVTPDDKQVLFADESSNRVYVYNRDPLSGGLTLTQTLLGNTLVQAATGTFNSPTSLAISPNGNFVYVSSGAGRRVDGFARNAATGVISIPSTIGQYNGNEVGSLAISPDGLSIIETRANVSQTAVSSLNPTTGAMTSTQLLAYSTGSPASLRFLSDVNFSPDGRHVYSAAPGNSAIGSFARQVGALQSVSPVVSLTASNHAATTDFLAANSIPKVNSISQVGSPSTNAATRQYTVTFSEAVTGVDASDFEILPASFTSASISSVTGSGTTYTVTVIVGANVGNLQLKLADNDTIVDVGSEPIGGAGFGSGQPGDGSLTSSSMFVDTVPPSFVSIVADQPLHNSLTSVSYTLTFSESISNYSGKFSLDQVGVSGALVSSVLSLGSFQYRVNITTGTGDGALRLLLPDNDTVTDPYNNPLNGVGSSPDVLNAPTYTIERNPLRGFTGKLYSDANRNQTFDSDEVGIAGVKVYSDVNNNSIHDATEPSVLTLADDLATVGVDEAGNYTLGNFVLGTYRLRTEVPAGFLSSTASTSTITTVITSPLLTNVNLGLEPNLTSISGAVFLDLNANGIVDNGETGLAGMTVYRDLNNNGVLNAGEPSQLTLADDPATTEINEAGTFSFNQLLLGNNRIRVQVPSNYIATSTTLFSGNVVTSIDTFNNVSFLLHENLTTVSGVLYNDLNSNGTQDAGEGPQSGLVVYVDSDRDGARDTGERFTTTDIDGSYTIAGVSPGNILVRVVAVGQTLVTSPTFQSERLFVSNSSTLREINSTTGAQISSFSISPVPTRGATSGGLAFNGTSVFMLDRVDNRILVINPSTGVVTGTLGPLPTAFYGGLAYVNSLLYASDNTNERILAINPATGTIVSTFNIATLNAGTPFYNGTIDLLDGLGESADGTKLLAGTVTQQRLIINPTTGIVEGAYTDLINERDLGIAGGGGRIFVGRRDTSSVQVYNASGTLTSTLNSVSTPDDVAASVISLPGANLTVVLDQQVTGINFGIGSSVGTISGRQYQDVNQNGSFDSGDVPVAGVRVYVDANNNESFDGTEASALTAADGTYSITGVTPGSYAVRVVTPANFRPASSYPASNRLFGISLETGSNLVRLLEFNPITGATIRSNLTTIVGTSNSEIAYDGNRIFLVNSSATLANNNIYELAIDGTILDQQPLQAGTVVSDFGPVVIGGVIFTLRGTGSALSLHRYDTESKQFVYQRTVTYNWDPQSFQPGASTPFPVLAYVSGVSTDGQSIILGTSDDRILTIDPATGIANFAMTASSLLPVDYARDSVGGEMYVAQYVAQVGLIAVFNAAGTQVRTLGVNRLLHGLGAGLHRNTATAVTVTAGQTVSNIDHRLVSTRSTISGTIVADANANKVNDAGDSPLAGIAVYLDTNRNSVYDVGEPQVVTNSSGQYTFTDVVPGEYVVRQVPVSDQTSQAWTANYNRLFTRTLANGVATISEIDPMTGQILRQFPTPGTNAYQTGLALRGDILYVSQSSVLYALDANTGTIISVTPLPSGQLDGLAIVGDKAYVLQSTTNKILVVDLATKLLERTIDVQSTNPSTTWNLINGLGESADGTLLAARNNSDVSIIDPATGLLVYTIPSILAGAGLAGAGGETYDQGNYVNNVQVFTDVRDRNGLIRRSLPHGFGVTANGYAAANVQAAEHRVRVFGEQSIANLNFGNVANPTISGTQYVDVNQSGVFDAGDTPLAGVTVFADLNNDHFPDAHEPQSVSAVDGSYTLTNLPSTPVVVRTVAPLNYAPTGTYVSVNRLFGTYSITDATSPTGFRLGIREYDPVTGVVLGQTSTSIQYSFGNSITFDSDSLIVVDTTRKLLIQLTTTGTLLAEVAIPSLQASDSIVGVVNVQDKIYVMTRTSSSIVHLHQYDSRARVFRDVKTVTQSSGPSLATANLAPTLGEAPDGRSILAVSAARSSILVIDPISATVVREVPVSNYSSLSNGMTSVDGQLLVSGTTNTLGVLDGEFKFVRNASTSFSSVPGLGGGTFNDFGKTALVAAGAQLTGFNHSYRSTLPRDGQLDRDFGNGGITTTEFFSNANSYDESQAVAIDSLGRTITVGTGGYIIRHNADGSLDTTFGVNGLAHFPGTAVDVAINSSNQIIVAGSVFTGNGFQFVLARYVSNGSLDLSFGNQGIQRTTFSTVRANASAMVLQSDGKIVVVGTGSDGAVTYRDILVARYLPNGHLDSTFSNDGMTTASINAYDYAADVAVRFGEIVVAGSTQVGTTYDMAIWLFDATGSLNTAFDGDGIKTIDFAGTDDEAFAVAVSTEGRITVAGYSKVGSYENTAIAQVEANGTLNTTFDTDGKVVTNVSSGNDRAEAIVFDPLGQIVVTGSAASTFGISNVSLLRLNSNGSLDTTLDGDGIVTTNLSGAGLSDNGRGLAIRTDGRIVVVGSSDLSASPTNYDALLIQYTATGALDTTFQSTGIVTMPIPVSTDEAYSVALQADGKLIAAGSSRNSSNLDFALARYDAYGRLDTSYGTGGKVTTAIGTGDDIVRRVIIRSDGKAIAIGRTKVGSNWNIALAQYNVDGTLDTSFGTAGIVTTDLGSTEDDGIDVVLDANQRIVVVGQKIADGSDIVLVRYLPNGSLDTSFGTAGLTTFSLGGSSEIAASVLVQGDGKILIGGYSNVSGNNDFVIARFLATGTLDSTFDSDGWASADFGTTQDYLQSLTFTHNGKIVAAGTRDAAGNFDFVITQFNSDGSLDTSFGTGGFTTTEFLGGTDVIRRVRVADDGKLFAAGYSNDPVRATVDFALARYTAAGVLDATFEGNGKTTTSVGTLNNVGWDMVVDHNGEIVIAGSAISGGSTDFALARYAGPVTADLALDSSNNLLIRHSATSSNRTIRFEGTNVIVTDSLANMTTTIADATGSGSSTITLPLSSFTGSLVYRTNDGDQTLTLDLSLASLSRSLTILGEKGTDQLNVIGGSFANAYLQFSGADSGQITLDGNSFIQFDGLVAINTTTAFGSFTATYPDGSSALTLDSPLVNQVRLTHSSAPTLTLASPSQSLVVHAGSGDDTISLSGLPSDFAANLSIDGGAGTDIVTVTGPLSLVGGDLAIDADAIVANAAISTAGGDVGWTASGNVQLNSSLSTTGGNVNIHADSDADGDGLFQVRPTLTSQYSAPQFVTASDGAGGDWFGSSVAVQGDTAFIAADGDQNFGNDSGSVYVFTKSNGVWTETQKIVPSDGAANDYFGFPLAIDGDTAVISASRHEVAGATDAGAVYVYRKIAGVWAFEQKLTASDADANDWFGTSVAIEGDTIAVSSPQDDAAAIDAGAVYVFTRSGSTWTQQQKLVATSPLAYQKLGDSVALSNQTIVVGATQDSEGFSQAGSAFVFSRANGVWSQTQKLTSPTPSVYALFGSAVDVDNGTLVVTARFADNESILNAGAAFVYVNQNGTWVLQTKLSPEVAAAEGWFGWTASIVGDSLAIGALRGGNPIANHGAVYNYLRVGDSWYDQSKLVGDISGNGDSYGFAIHHDAQTLVVGAYRNDTPAVETGSAYFYALVNGTTPGGSIQTGGGNTVITTHSIELHGPITGTGTLSIRPSVASSSIGLGGTSGTLNLDDFEVTQLADGFSNITIGQLGSGSGTIMAQSATFTDPVTLAGGIIRESDATAITAPQLTLSGNLSPGQSPGITTFDSSVTISSGSTVTIEYAGTAGPGLPTGHDQVVATGSFHIEPNVTLALVSIGVPPFAGPLTIVQRTGGSGTFASIPEGHVFTNPFGNGQNFHITYAGSDGDDIVLVGHNAPTDITLSSTSINENVSTNSADLLFATLGASDPDAGETHAYSLASGTGDVDNNSFRVVGNQLFVKQGAVLDFETKPSYQIRLSTTDNRNLSYEKSLTLTVTDLDEAVVMTTLNSSLTGLVRSPLVNSGTWSDPENRPVTLSASLGDVVKNTDGTWTWTYTPLTSLQAQPVTITANDGTNLSSTTFNITSNAKVNGRNIFYNGATGANLSSAGAATNAIDTSKTALRTPGATSDFSNYTNYVRGLNGLIVDIDGLPATTTEAQVLASLQFAQWDGIAVAGFVALPAAIVPSVTILHGSGEGGSTRIKITFPDNAIQNTWLRTTVLANAATMLAADDAFYFGNVIAEVNTGNTATRLRVNATDTGAVRSNQSTGANSASVTNIYDLNRDGRVNATDTGIVRSNQQTAGIVAPITVPLPPSAPLSSSPSTTSGSDGFNLAPALMAPPDPRNNAASSGLSTSYIDKSRDKEARMSLLHDEYFASLGRPTGL